MSERDGGPAFPQALTVEREFNGSAGMTLRDYFAAHAPKLKWPHFHPVMPPRPVADWGDIPGDQRFDVDPINWQAIETWKAEERRQYELQWPYFYADALLAERSKV